MRTYHVAFTTAPDRSFDHTAAVAVRAISPRHALAPAAEVVKPTFGPEGQLHAFVWGDDAPAHANGMPAVVHWFELRKSLSGPDAAD